VNVPNVGGVILIVLTVLMVKREKMGRFIAIFKKLKKKFVSIVAPTQIVSGIKMVKR